MSGEKKSAVISFKAEDELLTALEKIPNKSHFIRSAVLSALAESCPFCGGSGFLNPSQKKHWAQFARKHTLHRCGKCNGLSIECRKSSCADKGTEKRKEKKEKCGK